MMDDSKSLPAGAGRKRPAKRRRVYAIANPSEGSAGAPTPPFYPPPTDSVEQTHQSCLGETRIFLTADSGIFKVVDVTGARDAAFIRERIFADMQISDESQAHFSIYRTEVGSFAIGDALTDEHLFELCRDQGDSYASLKFMVSHTSAAVHAESPLDSSDETRIFVTADLGIFKVVDVTGARDAAFIRERIFADMQISDESQTHFSIYRTEVGSFAIGGALTNEHLFKICHDHGDSYASLKFVVSHTSATVHESPLDPSYSQEFYTIPPPVVVPRSNGVYSPVRSQHPSSSPPRSLSSAGIETIPQESGGSYDASASDGNEDAAERDPNSVRTTQRIIPPFLRPQSPPTIAKRGRTETAPLRIEKRRDTNPATTTQRTTPPSLRLQSPPSIAEKSRTETAPLRIEKRNLPSHPPQPLSPGNLIFPFMPIRRPPRVGSSDAALERERALDNAETKLELPNRRWGAQQQGAEEREKQRTREREAQRRPQPKGRETVGSEHWTVISTKLPNNNYKRVPLTIPPRSSSEHSSRNMPGGSFKRMVDPPLPDKMPTRQERPDIKPLPQRPAPASIHQAHSYAQPLPYPTPSLDVPPIATLATASMSASRTQGPTPNSLPIPSPLKSPPSDDDSDSDSNAGGTLWAVSDNTGGAIGTWQTTLQSDRKKSLPRLIVDPTAPQWQQQKQSRPAPLPQVPPFIPPEYHPSPGRPPKPPTKPLFNTNRTIVFNEDLWQPGAEMHERLSDFSPEHDLDEGKRIPHSAPVDPRDTITTFVSESAFSRLIGRAFAPRELPTLVEAIFSSRGESDKVRLLLKEDAQTFIDVIDEVLDKPNLAQWARKKCLKSLYRTCGHHALLPSALKIPICYDRNGSALYRGGFADVWKGEHCGRDVAVKVIRTYSNSDLQKIIGRFCKEVMTWKTLRHPNVLPLIGVTMSETQFAMISDWMVNGNINDFVKARPDANRLELLGGVARGLIYIHGQEMVHGDLKGANIVIDRACCARLADFGLLTIISDPRNLLSSSSYSQGGTARWMSPELIDPQRFGFKKCRPTKQSDCYTLGMVIYETISGHLPFHRYGDLKVFSNVLAGGRPPRGAGFTDPLWKMLEMCWAPQQNNRPSIEDVLQCLEVTPNLSEQPSVRADEEIEGHDDWDSTDSSPSAGSDHDTSPSSDDWGV